MITREQVADLRPGDVVELRDERWPDVVTRGPVHESVGGYLWLGDVVLRDPDARRQFSPHTSTLTVVSRAPRPLYVNHPRTAPAFGDVVRMENDRGRIVVWIDGHGWLDAHATEWDPKRKDGLRLLVDGTTGEVVP